MKRLMITAAMALAAPALAMQAALAQGQPPAREPVPLLEGEEEGVWARPEGLELTARIYRPADAAGPLPVIVDVHGGAWSAGDRTNGAVYARALAAEGFMVVSVDFRDGPEFQHPTASADVAAAIRWVRLNAEGIGADPERIGLIGSSSGAHLALLAGMKPNVDEHTGTPIVDMQGAAAAHDEIDASVDYVVALWPVSDPLARFNYAKEAGIEALQRGHEAYFGGDEAIMTEASAPRIARSGEAESLPPLLIVHPGEDTNVPQPINLDMLHAYQEAGGFVQYAFYPGQAHGFGAREGEATDDMLSMVADFARRNSSAE